MSAVRLAARAVLGLLAAFVGLEVAAIALYPGGTWLDRTTTGYDFFRNFFCDVSAPIALNGAPNPGARFGTAAIVVVGFALFPFWFCVTDLFRAQKLSFWAVRILGVFSAAGLVSVPLLPSQRYGFLHAAAIFFAGIPGILAGILATIALLREKGAARWPGIFGAITLAFAALDGALYTGLVLSHREITSPLLPTLQKLAAMALIAWMGVTAAKTEGNKSS